MIRAHSPIAELGIRAATPLALLVAAYLLFAGHNRPGGGFAAGLVVGAIIILRAIVGIGRAASPITMLSIGVLIVVAVAAMPMIWGDTLLDQAIGSVTLPIFGKVKSGTALVFDVGVTTIVAGVIVSLVGGFPSTQGGRDQS